MRIHLTIRNLALIGILAAFAAVVTYFTAAAYHILKYRNNEFSSIREIRSINIGQQQFRVQFGSYGTLEDLVKANLIRTELRTGQYSGYRFRISTSGSTFKAIAVPLEYGPNAKGGMSLYVDETGVIRHTYQQREPGSDDSPLP